MDRNIRSGGTGAAPPPVPPPGPPGTQIAALVSAARRLSQAAAAPSLARADVASRLDASVVRPLSLITAADSLAGDQDDRAADGDRAAELDEAIWRLAGQATRLRTGQPELLEATAALQQLTVSLATSPETAAGRTRRLAAWQADLPTAIELSPNGPYLVTNPERIEDWLGCPAAITPQMALCRCGRSQRKPLCDGSHASGFDDGKDPGRVADRRDTYPGQQVTVYDNRGICQHSGLCTSRLATVFRAGQEPFVAPSGGRMDEIVRAVRDCPSGALSFARDGTEARADTDHHGQRPPVIQVTRDGPYRVTGAIPLRQADGRPVPMADGASAEHYALCRCGHSRNKPFCSGMHWHIGFRDPVPAPGRTPTIFEWAGGLPALTRMTRLFYEKFVPESPVLAPLFANMSADHPERVARWLSEVFGGPPLYSGEYGGYPRMLSQHVGKNLSEEWRQEWVALLLRSAGEAGLPNDPEFRSAFSSYIEWGSRLAVENSQLNATPPAHMPMPHWDWATSAGPPGSRGSALATIPADPGPASTLPASGETVSYEKHIRQLFRQRDRQSMSFAFDLWSCEDVRSHASAILQRLRSGTMPCDGPWPAEWIDVFARWTDTGQPA